MSDNLARARARVAAGEWLARYTGVQDPKTMTFSVAELLKAFEEGYATRINDDVMDGSELTLTATVLDAASSGMGPFTESDLARAAKAMFAARDRIDRLIKGQQALIDDHTITVATGQRQLDNATALMTEAVAHLKLVAGHFQDEANRIKGRVPDDHRLATMQVTDAVHNSNINLVMAARLEAWLRGEDQFPVSMNGFADGGVVTGATLREGEIPAVLSPAGSLNPARVLAQIGETMVNGDTIVGVDLESFERAGEWMDQPVEVSPLVAAMTAGIDEISSLPVAPAGSLADVRRHWAEGAGFKYWPGGDGPPDDLDENGEVIIDWGEQTESGPRFTMCGVGELTPMPGLWAETIDPESFGTIIGYHADPTMITEPVRRIDVRHQGGVVTEVEQTITYETEGPDFDFTKPVTINGHIYVPAGPPTPGAAVGLGKLPRELVAAEPDPLAALVHARNWLMSAEDLIATASAHIRELTGARAGSDSAELCARLDAWLSPLAERTAPTEEN